MCTEGRPGTSSLSSVKRAITNCINLQTVILKLGPRETPWTQNEVLSALYHLPSLKTLHLYVEPSYLYRLRLATGSSLNTLTHFRIEYLALGYLENEAARQMSGRNLSQFISRCPNLISLEVAFPGLDLTDIFPGIRSGDMSRVPPIQHLSLYSVGKTPLVRDIPNLQSLAIRLDPESEFLDIWDLLRQRRIFPRKILTDRSIYESDLLNYLHDHPRLESLLLYPVNTSRIPDVVGEQLALASFCEVVQRHAQHIVEFVLCPSPSWVPPFWNWSWVRERMEPALLSCRNMQRLGFRISEDYTEMQESLHQLLRLSAEVFDDLQDLHIYFYSDVQHPHPLAPRPFMHLDSNNPSERLKLAIEKAVLAYEVDDWRKYNYELHIHQRTWSVTFGETKFTCTRP
ncbi:hypothetical protein CVT24_010374 [Panaeolus cyanescens]|uniref:F-box domain-containing protein n=1 Tax=Panaeolus cyanescens TaxID=181874 RepID=A0A409VEQ1_9AGAR|nr:hypothetical protein CVT24_010374 [Panaeolus cyanescens]